MCVMQSTQTLAVDSLGIVTLVVEDIDTSLAWYQDHLGFELGSDEAFEMDGETGRWATIAPAGSSDVQFTLVEVDDPMYEESRDLLESRLGTDQMLTFNTRDIDAAVTVFEEQDVDHDDIMEMAWGRFVMFRDVDGNELQLYENPELAA